MPALARATAVLVITHAVHRACVLTVAAGLAVGCAAHRMVLDPVYPIGGSGAPYLFWPPPPSTSMWSSAADFATFGEAQQRIACVLHDAGYDDLRWYRVGGFYDHGFVAVTRLEHIQDDGPPRPGSDRWSTLYPEASNLTWLAADRAPNLPAPGRYRVLLVAFTDLPIGPSNRAALWNERTVMDGPDLPRTALPSVRRASAAYRLGVISYEYVAASAELAGKFVPSGSRPPAAIMGLAHAG